MEEQVQPEMYEPPALVEVGSFSADTLGCVGWWWDGMGSIGPGGC